MINVGARPVNHTYRPITHSHQPPLPELNAASGYRVSVEAKITKRQPTWLPFYVRACTIWLKLSSRRRPLLIARIEHLLDVGILRLQRLHALAVARDAGVGHL